MRRYDQILREIIRILREDYAGYAERNPDYEPNFYVTWCGMAVHNAEINDDNFTQMLCQMLATTGDRSLDFRQLNKPSLYPGFYARRFGEELYVTAVNEEKRLRVGDQILKVNTRSPGHHRAHLQKNFLYADTPERELWSSMLTMAKHILVAHADGTQEDIRLESYPRSQPMEMAAFRSLDADTVYFRPMRFTDSGAMERFVLEKRDEIATAKKLILDLRMADGMEEAAMLPLLPCLFSGSLSRRALLPPTKLLTKYTKWNCEHKAASVVSAYGLPEENETVKQYVEELMALAGQGEAEESVDMWEDLPDTLTGFGPEKVILITDTWCENAAEAFVQAAKRLPQVKSIGRPTMGTLDYCNPVSVVLDNDFLFNYPMSRDAGCSTKGRGIPVDIYIPWTPEECERDLLLAQAMAL